MPLVLFSSSFLPLVLMNVFLALMALTLGTMFWCSSYTSVFSGGFSLEEDWDRIECGVMEGVELLLACRS